jgi:ParB-like chromosome segregation protein Spo0J
MQPVEVEIAKIKANDANPRSIKGERFEKLCQSLKEFPEMMRLRPIVVDADGTALGGNMRLRAAQRLGWAKVWVVYADQLTEEQKKRFIIADNVGFGEWDWDVLANEWDSADLEAWGLELPDVSDGEDEGNFNDPGIPPRDQYGVIVMAEDEKRQKEIFDSLTGQGLECKIVVV